MCTPLFRVIVVVDVVDICGLIMCYWLCCFRVFLFFVVVVVTWLTYGIVTIGAIYVCELHTVSGL